MYLFRLGIEMYTIAHNYSSPVVNHSIKEFYSIQNNLVHGAEKQ